MQTKPNQDILGSADSQNDLCFFLGTVSDTNSGRSVQGPQKGRGRKRRSMRRRRVVAGEGPPLPTVLRVCESSPDSAETSFRELDDVFLQTQTKIWLAEVLHLRFEEEATIADLLADGELLFLVSKVIWKMLLKKCAEMKYSKVLIHERTSSGKSSGRYMAYPKIDSFLKICQILGLTSIDLFSASDVVEKRDTRRVCMSIRSLSKKARLKILNVPDFDIVTYTIAMPTDMVGYIRRNLEQSKYNSSRSNSCNPCLYTQPIYRQKVFGSNSVQHHDTLSELSEAESTIEEFEFHSPTSNSFSGDELSYFTADNSLGRDSFTDETYMSFESFILDHLDQYGDEFKREKLGNTISGELLNYSHSCSMSNEKCQFSCVYHKMSSSCCCDYQVELDAQTCYACVGEIRLSPNNVKSIKSNTQTCNSSLGVSQNRMDSFGSSNADQAIEGITCNGSLKWDEGSGSMESSCNFLLEEAHDGDCACECGVKDEGSNYVNSPDILCERSLPESCSGSIDGEVEGIDYKALPMHTGDSFSANTSIESTVCAQSSASCLDHSSAGGGSSTCSVGDVTDDRNSLCGDELTLSCRNVEYGLETCSINECKDTEQYPISSLNSIPERTEKIISGDQFGVTTDLCSCNLLPKIRTPLQSEQSNFTLETSLSRHENNDPKIETMTSEMPDSDECLKRVLSAEKLPRFYLGTADTGKGSTDNDAFGSTVPEDNIPSDIGAWYNGTVEDFAVYVGTADRDLSSRQGHESIVNGLTLPVDSFASYTDIQNTCTNEDVESTGTHLPAIDRKLFLIPNTHFENQSADMSCEDTDIGEDNSSLTDDCRETRRSSEMLLRGSNGYEEHCTIKLISDIANADVNVEDSEPLSLHWNDVSTSRESNSDLNDHLEDPSLPDNSFVKANVTDEDHPTPTDELKSDTVREDGNHKKYEALSAGCDDVPASPENIVDLSEHIENPSLTGNMFVEASIKHEKVAYENPEAEEINKCMTICCTEHSSSLCCDGVELRKLGSESPSTCSASERVSEGRPANWDNSSTQGIIQLNSVQVQNQANSLCSAPYKLESRNNTAPGVDQKDCCPSILNDQVFTSHRAADSQSPVEDLEKRGEPVFSNENDAKRGAGEEKRPRKRILLKSLAGGMSVLGSLFLLLHFRGKGVKETIYRTGPRRNRIQECSSTEKGVEMDKPKALYPGDRLKL